jgi:hypothetical protein
MFDYVPCNPAITCIQVKEANTPNAVAAAAGEEGGDHGLEELSPYVLTGLETSAIGRSFSLSGESAFGNRG